MTQEQEQTPKTQTFYQDTPDVYEHDLHSVVQVIDELNLMLKRCDEVYLDMAVLSLCSKNGYTVGILSLNDDQWVFTPHNESDVNLDIDVEVSEQ